MAQEGSEASVASSSPAPNWWELHSNPLSNSNWSNTSTTSNTSTIMNVRPWQHHHQPPHSAANSCDDQDISISTTSFTNSSSADPPENHLWSQVLFSVGNGGSGGGLHNGHVVDDGENFLEVLSSKSQLPAEMFDPACDYLKKLDSSWEFANPSPVLHSLEKHLGSSYNGGGMIEPERLTNLSDLVSNWSIAPPNPQLDRHIPTTNISLNPSVAQLIKHELHPSSPSYNAGNGMIPDHRSATYLLPFAHDIKGEGQHHDMRVSEPGSLLRPLGGSGLGCQGGLNSSIIGLGNKYCGDAPWSNGRNLSDLISFGSCLNSKPAMEFRASRNSIKGSESSDSKKQGYETSSSTRGSGRSGTTGEGKKKRSEDGSETLFKKSKHENSSVSSAKLQVPKVKLGERITALQQIVSPFGKTDTASVLLEAINYIRFLQEQVQLLSDPYLKSSANKDHNSWGGLERKEKTEPKLELRSRGLCLVPISCTPQVYRENNGPDYWTPTYRGCLYR